MQKQAKLLKIYKRLLAHFGPQRWWPGDTPFEVIIGAILTQSANWGNVEMAIDNLKREKVLNPKKILEIRYSKLEKLIRPSGYFRAKAKKVKAFVKHLVENYNGSLKRMFNKSIPELREELLAIHGIGPETADSIICYAAYKPTFVVDAYTKRIGNRVGLFKLGKYYDIKDYFEGNLPKKYQLLNEYHALIVALGKYFCKSKPICDGCPIFTVCQRKI
ncbi:MAG: endonuclease III domain-containing protein [Candidatus Margulisbacteria bacterium]|nr:endonuclease III domain-containing protein [Candidatus Margulisiibacteriota bacterium]